MKVLCGLIWTLSQVCWALEGPQRVSAPHGSSISLQCKYTKEDKEYVKFWCREQSHRFCCHSHLVQTTGSEAEVKVNKTSIKDNHIFHEFRVTIENVTEVDAGTYLCGVERWNYDISHQVEIIITTASLSPFSVLVRNREQETNHSTGSTIAPESIQSSNTDFLFTVILKIPICLIMIAAVVWVNIWYKKGRCPRTKTQQNEKSNFK
uniref:CD300c molecule n=1 Tax=Anolis carolinensis TaxID=28377 RepID=R4GBH2_ANOCA|nr:PREDICTED: CMRF35-like molecule 4 [Anolis carolinensis]|eukprot:XP_003217274.1 PREDICTED: CMRF35-like molecule 4 [Anolis carolinensis]